MAFPITPPIAPMLAKLEREVPRGPGWLYEPKWDGFRAIVFRDREKFHIASRNALPLERYFPELIDVLREGLPSRCVVDGEIVIATAKGLDFDALQLRLHPAASRVNMLAKKIPSSFIAFDLLAKGVRDVRDQPLSRRRKDLESSIRPSRHLLLTPQTDDSTVAEQWFDRFEGAGLDGIIAKKSDLKYVPGERVMVKVKHARTADCVIFGYRKSKDPPGVKSLLLGLYDENGTLHFVGHTSSFKATERRTLLKKVRPLEKTTDSVMGRMPGGPSRWTGTRDLSWVSLKPVLVCEVAFDHMQGDRFRHGTTFRGLRPDKDPRDCTFDQVPLPQPFSLSEIRKLSSD